MASTPSAIRSPAPGPTMPTPITRLVSCSNRILVMPSSRCRLKLRPLAAQGKTPLPYLRPCCLASASVTPAHATSGSVNTTAGIASGSNADFIPEITSAATLPSCTALCANIGSPAMSPIAKILLTEVRICLSTTTKPRSLTLIPAFSASNIALLGRRPTDTSTRSNSALDSPSLFSKLTFKPFFCGLIPVTLVLN